MHAFKWIAFDADDTLFHYQSYAGLCRVLARYGVAWNETLHRHFQAANASLWLALQNGAISMTELAQRRFASLAVQTGQSALTLNHELQLEMIHISQAVAGVPQLLKNLKNKGMGIAMITNGFSVLQRPRLQAQGLLQYIDVLVVSEEVGYAKPDARIFEWALAQMGNPLPAYVLMVGDSLISDIQGAKQVGMKTCWFAASSSRKHEIESVQADFVVRDWFEFAAKMGLALT
ncbi:MAG: pyrimidine 5'-nucleotidase [Alysiella sp.]|uniref:pyrimidine 5'-nucleotidase n=1 Tax=Alysiella sp. TaxID=1872483 RepID=UPI0026DB45E9|nr:pyrimidine 5'-nucleotidase [Alysiella sp.]MDO4433817.1 pyrimidine 5'-nucleotidase [Alysiella sp.]